MASYIILPGSDGASFNVGITGADGTRQTILGFPTKSEAEAWIIQDRRLNKGDNGHSAPDQRFAVGD
jgi:hypothetical protein